MPTYWISPQAPACEMRESLSEDFWAVECRCGRVIALARAALGEDTPHLRGERSLFSVFCERCGQILCRAEEIRRRRGPMPPDSWLRTDLFEAFQPLE